MMTLREAHQILKTSNNKELIKVARQRIEKFLDAKNLLKSMRANRHLRNSDKACFRKQNPTDTSIWLGYDPPRKKHKKG